MHVGLEVGIVDDAQKCQKAKEILQEWVDQQGHERCWYYPDVFRKLTDLFHVDARKEPRLPPLEEFKEGCRKYQAEEYKSKPQ